MRVRHKKTGAIGSSSTFNTHGLGEIIVRFDEGDMDSCFLRDYDVQLPDGSWKDMSQAFRDHDLITDNYNTRFAPPSDAEERQRGYWL